MIRNRKDRKTGTIATHDKEIVKQSNDDEETFKDPIKQFGTIVPSELYKCQQNFNNGLNQLIEIINLQIQIKIDSRIKLNNNNNIYIGFFFLYINITI